MAHDTATFDVTEIPELRRVAEEVRASREPVALRSGNETLAILMPVPSPAPHRRRPLSRADYDAAMSAAGSWRGLVDDPDQLKADLEAARGSDRPPVDL